MTKAQLIASVAKKIDSKNKELVSNVLTTFFDVIKDEMAEGNNIYIRGFGSFTNKKRAQKIGRNITKKEQMTIPERYVPVFKPAKVFVNLIKNSDKVKEAYAKSEKEN